MLSAFNTPKSLAYIDILPEYLPSDPIHQQNFLQKSEIQPLRLINSERFSDLNSFSLRNFTFVCESEDKSNFQIAIERQQELRNLEDPLYNVLSLRRGRSECYVENEDHFSQAQQYFIEEPTALIDIDEIQVRQLKSQYFSSELNLHFLRDHEDSSGDSKNMISTSNEGQLPLKEKDSTQAKISTKNVTKNMGKLLFKYIWKNRISLRKNFNISADEWDSFISEIRVWKKENNITRQYLNTRWHSNEKNSKIFRIISHNFFRKRCLSAIIESKIQCKQMHIKRLRRFQEATSNANALDNLN